MICFVLCPHRPKGVLFYCVGFTNPKSLQNHWIHLVIIRAFNDDFSGSET